MASDPVTSSALDDDLDDPAGGTYFEIFQQGSREAWGKVVARGFALTSDPQRRETYPLVASIVEGLYQRRYSEYQVRAFRLWIHEASEHGVEMALELAAEQLGPGQDAWLKTLRGHLDRVVEVGAMAMAMHDELDEMNPRLFHDVIEPIFPLVAEWAAGDRLT